MTEFFAQPDDMGEIRSSDLHTSLGERLGAQGGEALFGGTRQLLRMNQYNAAERGDETLESQISRLQGGEDLGDVVRSPRPAAELPIADAKARIKQEGLEGRFKLPEQDTIKQPVLDLMIAHAHERRQLEAAVNRGPQGFLPDALGMATEMGAGIIDPVNIAAFSIPVVGEARWGMMMYGAGESTLARAGLRAAVGTAQGALGTTLLQPAEWWLKTKDGLDYTMADALHSIVLGAGMGGFFHAAHGGYSDLRARMAGRPLPGTVLDLQERALGGDVNAAALLERRGGNRLTPENTPVDEPGRPPVEVPPGAEEMPGITAGEPLPESAAGGVVPPAGEPLPPHPAEILADLPPRAREDVTRAAMADVISGNAVRGAELLQEAAKADPRIAESIEAWHGSPHDFDRFDMSKIGTGEGAQSFGHGLYFAENESVARGYRDNLSTMKGTPVQELLAGAMKDRSRAEAIDLMREHIISFEKDPKTFGHERYSVDDYREALSRLEAGESHGALYKVRINADREHFLDWDKPLNEQSEFVKSKIAAMDKKLREQLDEMLDAHDQPELEELTGNQFLQLLQRYASEDSLPGVGTINEANPHLKAEASKFIHNLGIPGIKYLDQVSRVFADGDNAKLRIEQIERALKESPSDGTSVGNARVAKLHDEIEQLKSPTRNIVVFDDKHVEITHKNGEPVSRGERQEILHAQKNNPDGAAVIPGPRAARGPRARDPETWSLNEFLASRGGIDPTDPLIGDVHHSIGASNKFVPGFGHLVRKGGMRLDQAREAAVEAGYIHDNGAIGPGQAESTIKSLLDAVDGELRGNRVYRAGHEPDAKHNAEQHRADIEREAHGALTDEGIEGVPDKTFARVVEIMEREGERDALVAYERAVMEETHYGAEAGENERVPDAIPGWDLPHDAGTAPGAGRAAAEGGERDAGGAARATGTGDRAAPGQKPDWQRLADAKRSDDDDLIAASREADGSKTPESTEPERAPSAAERAAADADKLLADILPTLTEEERARFTEALDALEADKTQREQIVREGTECLMAAVA